MTNLKVALLYRGQLRQIEHGVDWMNRLRIQLGEKNGTAEVKSFCNTSCTMMEVFTEPVLNLKKTMARQNTVLTIDESIDMVKKFRPLQMRVFEHPHMYRFAQTIIDYWVQNPIFPEFYCSQVEETTFVKSFFIRNHDKNMSFLSQNATKKELYLINQISIGDFVSQYISAGHALQMLDVHIEATGWIPDLIISLRYDSAIEIVNLDKLMHQITTTGGVFGNGVQIKKGVGHTDDVAFAMNYDDAKIFLGDIDNRVFKLLTDWKILTTLSEPNENMNPHMFWNFLTRFNTVIENSVNFRSSIIRPGIETHYDMNIITLTNIQDYFIEWQNEYIAQLAALPDKERYGNKSVEYALYMLGIPKKDLF